MTDKTEEQMDKERAAVDAMRNAKSNMASALGRIETLEKALDRARLEMTEIKKYIPEGAYTYRGEKRCRSLVEDAVESITKVLGR